MNLHVMIMFLAFVAPTHKDMPLFDNPAYSSPMDLMDDMTFGWYDCFLNTTGHRAGQRAGPTAGQNKTRNNGRRTMALMDV